MYGLVSYLAGPGRANEHTDQHVLAASSPELFYAGGAGGSMDAEHVHELASTLDEARVVFGTEVSRRDKKRLAAARERGVTGRAAVAEATVDENVWHCSLSLKPGTVLDDAQWSAIVHDFMAEMGFDDPNQAASRWVAIRHGMTKNGGDHIHIAASRVRDDGTVIPLFAPHPDDPARTEGDWQRAQRVARSLEVTHDLEPLTSAKEIPTRGTHHAQSAHAEKSSRVDAPSVELARRVRAAAIASESEAEFVRLIRADGLLIRPAHYDKSDPDAVTGFSVGFPASEYSNRHGKPVMHGGKKLGEDLSLPRLRERWIDDENARADAQSAWQHTARTTPSASPPPRTETAVPETAAIDTRLRAILRPLAQSSATEADYVRAVRAHKDVLIRPRFARGSTTEVTGYSVALRPGLAADGDGKPIWRPAGYLDNDLKLSALRQRWPSGPEHQQMAAAAWRRTATRDDAKTAPPRGDKDARSARAAADADRWATRVGSVADRSSKSWHSAAGDTAAAVGAAARGMSGTDARELNRLADALSGAAGERRATRPVGSRANTRSAVARVAATMLAASGSGDTTMLWLVVARQVVAASRAVAEAMAAQGHARPAREIRAASAAVDNQFARRVPEDAARESTRPHQVPRRPVADPTERPRTGGYTPPSTSRDRGSER